MERVTLRFSREKETKNTVRFAEDERPGQPAIIGAVYVQKWAAGATQAIRGTFEDDGEPAKGKR